MAGVNRRKKTLTDESMNLANWIHLWDHTIAAKRAAQYSHVAPITLMSLLEASEERIWRYFDDEVLRLHGEIHDLNVKDEPLKKVPRLGKDFDYIRSCLQREASLLLSPQLQSGNPHHQCTLCHTECYARGLAVRLNVRSE